jgi:PKD repeat protein
MRKNNFFFIIISFVIILLYSLTKLSNSVANEKKSYSHSHIHTERVTGAPGAKTGAPGEGRCTDCHAGVATQNSTINSIKLFEEGTEIESTTYKAGENYTARVSIDHPAIRIGFQTTARVLSDNSTAGLLNGITNSTALLNFSGKQYINHIQASTTSGGQFTFAWKAPNSNVGEVKFYIASNVTNNNGNNSGDQIHLSNHSYFFEESQPIASFSVSNQQICKNQSVNFISTSTGAPTSYFWEFEGGTPTFSNDENPVVAYENSGVFNVKLTVTNNLGSSEEIKSEFIEVSSCANLKTLSKQAKINIYPNPVSSKQNIMIENTLGFNKIKILELNGKEIKTIHLSQFQNTIILEDFEKGIYLLIFENKIDKISQKLIVH